MALDSSMDVPALLTATSLVITAIATAYVAIRREQRRARRADAHRAEIMSRRVAWLHERVGDLLATLARHDIAPPPERTPYPQET